MKLRIAIIIPAYNESRVIGGVVRDVLKQFSKTPYDFECIVINDGSQDDTTQCARAAGAHVIDHLLNMGSGGATATGLAYANRRNFDMAVTLDADGQHKATDVLKGIEVMSESDADLLIGSRLIQSDGMSRTKVIGNRGLSTITYLLFGVAVTDSQSGLRVFSKRALQKLRWDSNGYEFCSEMLWRAKQSKLNIQEYPIQAIYTEYSTSKGQNNWNAINIIKSLVARRVLEYFGE